MNDMSENNFWISIWLLVAISTIAICFMIASYCMDKNKLIATSDDPLITACALSDHDAKPCMAYLGSLK